MCGILTLFAALGTLAFSPVAWAQDKPLEVRVAAGTSLQQALDAAAEGAVIHLPAGTWKENLILRKSVTLVGQGEATHLEPVAPETVDRAVLQEREARLKAAGDGPEKEVLQEEWDRTVRPATVRVTKGNGVLQNLRLGALAPTREGEVLQEATVVHQSPGSCTLEGCILTGPGSNGLITRAGAGPLRVNRCLVAGFWNVGISLARGSGESAVISESTIRNCYYAGLVLPRANGPVVVEKCDISGAAWHGIRYDDASPEIRNCRIHHNARSGIYASGRTGARISGNVFEGNEMGGISCWFQNEDTITGNTFTGNLRESLAILGSSKPEVAQNIFAGSPLGILHGKIGGSQPAAQNLEPLRLKGNLFWQCETAIMEQQEMIAAPDAVTESLLQDPQLSAEGVSALAAGAKTPPPATSQWPVTAGEKTMIPTVTSRSYELWTKPGKPPVNEEEKDREVWMQAAKDAEGLIDGILQLDSVEVRDEALRKIATMLQSGTESEQRAALTALSSAGVMEYDRTALRPALRHLTRQATGKIQLQALQHLSAHEPEPEDLELALQFGDRKEAAVFEILPGVLASMTRKDFTGEAGKVLLRILQENKFTDIRTPIGAVWGADVSPELEEKIVELTRSREHSDNAIYFGLRTLRTKGPAATRRLLELLDSKYAPIEALWGLKSGIPDPLKPEACAKLVRAFGARSANRPETLQAIRHCATPASREILETLAAKPNLDPASRKTLQEILAALPPAP